MGYTGRLLVWLHICCANCMRGLRISYGQRQLCQNHYRFEATKGTDGDMMGKSQINQKVCNTWLEKNDSANLMFANISVRKLWERTVFSAFWKSSFCTPFLTAKFKSAFLILPVCESLCWGFGMKLAGMELGH